MEEPLNLSELGVLTCTAEDGATVKDFTARVYITPITEVSPDRIGAALERLKGKGDH
ncbi:hypothetical protein [Rhodococcus pyridinivorans]|uniref:hypothetical protein n=1 Tax=Rhodococcus pyridinivorans TaxID=103816 RepID=UPI003AAF22E4